MARAKRSKKQRDIDAKKTASGEKIVLHTTCSRCAGQKFRLSVKNSKWTRHCVQCGRKFDLEKMEDMPDDEEGREAEQTPEETSGG